MCKWMSINLIKHKLHPTSGCLTKIAYCTHTTFAFFRPGHPTACPSHSSGICFISLISMVNVGKYHTWTHLRYVILHPKKHRWASLGVFSLSFPILRWSTWSKIPKVSFGRLSEFLWFQTVTPPKTNISPKKGLFQYGIHLPTIDFQGTC